MKSEPDFFSPQILKARRFYLGPTSLPRQALTVVSGGCEHCSADFHINRPGLRYSSVEFVAAGAGSLTLNGKAMTLSAGDIFAYGPNIPHEIRTDPDRTLIKYFVDFTGRRGRDLLTPPGPCYGTLVQTFNPQDVRRLFEELITASQRSTPFRSQICAVILEHLLLRISETAAAPGTTGTAAFETYQRCHRLIADRFLELRGLPEMADACQVDAAYLCRLFNRFDYESPYEYLMRLRINSAADHLQTPGVAIKQVASQFGFRDQFTFSRTFRRVIGISPRQFLRLRSADQNSSPRPGTS